MTVTSVLMIRAKAKPESVAAVEAATKTVFSAVEAAQLAEPPSQEQLTVVGTYNLL